MTVPQSVLFVCEHGSAKSIIAAEHFRRLARERGQSARAASAGLELDAEVPPHVVAGLRADGFEVFRRRPQALTIELVRDADLVVSFGCALDALLPNRPLPVLRWDDVPAVSEGYETARDEIVRRLVVLLDEPRKGSL